MNPLRPMNNHQFNPFEPHPELDDIDVPDDVDYVNNTDPFGIFAARGMGAPPMMQPKEVRELAARRSERIFAGYRLLQSILERHESTIQKRWEKKSRPQRLSILLGAWPDMPLTHRPDFAAFRRNSNNIPRVAAQHRSAFLWPSINQEDLGDPRTLPLLLNARGRNHPHVFAAADGEQSHLGKVTMAIVPVFLNEHVMLINGMTEQKDYGKLLAWSEHEDAFDWMHERKQFLPGEGLLILEFQERLLGFLVECCQKILHDIPADKVDGDEYPIQPEPSLKEGVDATGFSTLGVLAREAAYRPPAKLDLGKIESLLAARTIRAEDHIWAMREDPSYFADILLDMKEHRQEMIKDLRGSLHPTLLPPREGLLWARVIGSVLTESFFQLEIFAELRTQVQRLQISSEKYKSQIDPGKGLPKEYLEALLKFRFYLLRAVKGVLEQLKMTTTASPPLRSLFVREVPVSVSSSMMQIMSKGVRMDETTKSLMWLLQTLWEDGNNLFLAKLTTVVDELDRLLRADPKASELVSSYIAGLVGELSIVGECLRQLEIYQPWANNFENAMVEREEEFKKEFAQRSASWAQVLECFNEKNTVGLRQLGDPTGGRFQYPIGKRRNKANVEMLRTSEANLDAFWSAVDQMLHKKVHKLSGTAYKKLLSQPRYLQRTPEWVEPTAKKDGKPSKRQVEELIVPFSRLFQSSEPVTSARAEALAAGLTKTKIKSRGAPGTMPEEENTEAALPAVIDDVQPIFKIDARALKVFRIVFFDPSANTTAGEVAWRDFLHAMDSTGFTAQKLYGSVWHFQPTKLDVERSIQFHEPHPRGKIPFLVARRHGRRLNRAYGWRGSMFVLEDKKN